jgi:ubiquinone/menaquinone biosynthesis C-methylase UbiE
VQDANIFFKAYSEKSDVVWASDLLASIANPRHQELEWPTMPPDSVQQGLHGSNSTVAIAEALTFRLFVKRSLREHGSSFSKNSILLDFGSGWGRMARAFMADVPSSRIFGLEPYHHILTARQNNPYVNFVQIDQLPPLPLRGDLASHLICWSVFTHLDWHFFDIWIKEIHRVLARDGVACLTTLGIRFLTTLKNASHRKKSGEKLHFWLELVLERLPHGRIDEIQDRISSGEYYFLPSEKVARPEFAECFVTDLFFRNNYAELFEVIAYSSDGELSQDCVVLRKR